MAASAPLPFVKGFDPELVRDTYPAPIARTFEGKLQQSQTPLHRLLGLTDVFEVALKYCAIIAIQEYLRLGVRSREVDEEIALHFRIPSLGSWNAFLREILRTFRGQQGRLLVPELVNFYFDPRGRPPLRQQQRIDELINLRNRIAHGARKSDEEAEEEFQKNWPSLAILLIDLDFLAQRQLILHDEDGSAHLLMGANPVAIELPVAARNVPRGQLCLVHAQDVLPLSPLLLYAHCGYPTKRGPCEDSKIFFFNSVKRKPEFLDYGMAHHTWPGEVTDRLRAIIEESAGHLNIAAPEGAPPASWELLQERSQDLVGRVDEEQQLMEFIVERPRGFLLIEGDPGIGKTALVSRTVHDLSGPKGAFGRSEELGKLASRLQEDRLHVAFHFCGADKNSLELAQILSSLIGQLPARISTSVSSGSDLATAARACMEQTGGKVLLAIDGVDEALAGRGEAERQTILDALLFRGERLPASVFVLLGSRRGSIPPLRDPELPTLSLVLPGLPEREIRRLLFRVVSKYELDDRHVEAIARVSAGNPLYIRMLAEDFAQGRLYLEDVDHLPKGVEGYFEKLLLRFASSSRWAAVRDTLLLLAVAHGFLSKEQISAVAGLSPEEVEIALDDELGPLLTELETPEGIPVFQLFHAKFREFLIALFSNQLRAAAETLNQGRRADPLVAPGHLQRIEKRMIEYCRGWAESQDTYPLRYLSSHLYETGATAELERLLTGTNFLAEKVRRLDDPLLPAEDISYLVRVWMNQHRDSDIVRLAANDSGFYRDGVASGLRAAGGDMQSRVNAIVQQLLEYRRLGLIAALRGQELPASAMNARRVAIELAYYFRLSDKLEAAALDRSRAVRTLAGPYLYRFWKKHPQAGWKVLRDLSHNMILPIGVPQFGKLESCGVMSAMIMIHHFEDPKLLDQLQEPWRENVDRLARLTRFSRLVLPPSLFVFKYALRHVMATQADFQPLNLDELLASYSRGSGQVASRKLGVECLAEMRDLDHGCERTVSVLLDTKVGFDVFLMQVAERVLFLHGYRDPGRIMAALDQIYREGCGWFHQSALYTGFHILRNVPNTEDAWMDAYKKMVRETVSESRGLFITPTKQYPLLPHMGWAEIIFDQHRPSAKAQFIPQFYREALALGDMEYARRVLRAVGVLSHAYDRHNLALLALEEAASNPPKGLRETLVELLANIRFYDETAVNRFLAQHATGDLSSRVLSATPSVRAADVFSWLDTFVNARMLASAEFRLQIAEAYGRGGTAKNLTQLLDGAIKLVMNLIAGREAIAVGSDE